MVNEHQIYVKMYVEGGIIVKALAIMVDEDVLQTKYIADELSINIGSPSIGDQLHIVIENVTKHMGTTINDAEMTMDETTITINDNFDSSSYGTWTSTIVPENVTVELDCVVVDNSSIIVAKCISETTWPNSVFNRIPIAVSGSAWFGYTQDTNQILFNTTSFTIDGSTGSEWKRYNVTGHESNLTIGNQVTIIGLPESFVSHWIDTIHAKAWMGTGYRSVDYAILVPPE